MPFPPLAQDLSGSLHPLVFSASHPHGAVRRRGCDLEKPSLVHRCVCPGFCTRVCEVRCDLEEGTLLVSVSTPGRANLLAECGGYKGFAKMNMVLKDKWNLLGRQRGGYGEGACALAEQMG